MLALQLNAERAGCALACTFSSSDEFEAAVIRARREAGAFGPRRQWRYAAGLSAAAAVLAILIWVS